VTRCTLETEKGHIGTAYVLGRAHRHAELAAVFDALLQDEDSAARVLEQVIEPLEKEHEDREEAEQKRTERTQVDFFTMVRGE
jgi:alpha-D-ribose 1-methylphosphonate 5-triphosphate synthase subunit PhnG